ncbi:MAG: GerMN domain-containing protein [Lachnospiraceae bacterium]
MRKRKLWMAVLLAGVLALTVPGCGNSGQEEASEESEAASEETEEEEKDAPAVTGTIVLYSANADADGYEMMIVDTEEVTAEAVIEQLVLEGTLPSEGIQVNSFEEKEEDGKKVLYLDLSSEFVSCLQGMGSTGETFTMGSVVNSFLATYGADLIQITVDGDSFESGHTEYSGFLSYYTA